MSAGPQERKVTQLENDVTAIYGLVTKLERGQRRHDARFDGIEARLDRHDGRFDAIDRRLDRHDGRFDAIDRRLDGIDGQLSELAQGLATVIDLVSRRPADD